MIHSRLLSLFFVIVGGAFATPAVAQDLFSDQDGRCALGLEQPARVVWNGADRLGYDPFDTQRHIEPVEVFVTQHGAACDGVIVVGNLRFGSQDRVMVNGRQFTARLSDTTAVSARTLVSATPFGEPDTQVRVHFPTSTQPRGRAVVFYLEIPEQQILPAGAYAYEYDVFLYAVENGVLKEVDRTVIPVVVEVKPVAQIAFSPLDQGGPLQPQVLDFGNDVVTGRRELEFYVRSNTRSRLEVSSDNAGVMRLVSYRGDGALHYTVVVDGEPTDLRSAHVMHLSENDVSSFRGRRMPLAVIMDNENRFLLAGDYHDTLRLRVIAD